MDDVFCSAKGGGVTFRISPPTLEDAAGLAEVHLESWRESYAGLLPADYLARLSFEKRFLARRADIAGLQPDSLLLLARDVATGTAVGMVSAGRARLASAPEFSADQGEVYALYVRQAFKGLGLGAELMRRAHGFFAAQGLNSAMLWVLENNHPARDFYEKMGWMPVWGQSKSLEIVSAQTGEKAVFNELCYSVSWLG